MQRGLAEQHDNTITATNARKQRTVAVIAVQTSPNLLEATYIPGLTTSKRSVDASSMTSSIVISFVGNIHSMSGKSTKFTQHANECAKIQKSQSHDALPKINFL